MVTKDRVLEAAEQAVISAIAREEPASATFASVINRLKAEGHREDIVRIAIVYLLNEDRLTFTRDRRLEVSSHVSNGDQQ